MPNVIVRPYQREDRNEVRRVCCETADMGGPIERLFPDREVAADLLTAYYTDWEPGSTFIAWMDGAVVGYVMGAMDNRRYGLVMNWILLPKILAKAFRRGLLFDRQVWALLRAAAGNWRRLVAWRKESFHSHQGHMHISVSQAARGQGVGRRLAEALLAHAAGAHAGEMTASVHAENQSGNAFFQRMGFTVKEKYPMAVSRDGAFASYISILYAKSLV